MSRLTDDGAPRHPGDGGTADGWHSGGVTDRGVESGRRRWLILGGLSGALVSLLAIASCTSRSASPSVPASPSVRASPSSVGATHRASAAATQSQASTALASTQSQARRPQSTAATPRPQHVVVAIMENHSYADIIGNTDAPFINDLARRGASFTRSFAVTHPSEPNYLALFSGTTQGIVDDSCPHTFQTPSLGGQLLGAGLSFAGYSEDLPGVGYLGCSSSGYARKHNPWVDFTDVPAAANRPMTAFGADYATLPAVSFVVPNLSNDMHDGSIATGDGWLRDHLSGYLSWAERNDSLLILTWDEDDRSQNNQIPTIIAGARVVPGSYADTIDHYRVLRTVEDLYGLPPIGAAATSAPITSIWTH
jgi:hypothetical protein